MDVEGLGAVQSSPRQPVKPMGVSAELAESRKKLRAAAGPDRWEAVAEEVRRLQFEQGMPPLAALQAVYDKLASGWVPR